MRTSLFRIASIAMMTGSLLSAGQAAAWGRFDGGHHPVYGGDWAHRNPVVVHNTYVTHAGGGCVGCGLAGAAVAGLVGGAILGAAIAGSAPPPPPTTVVVQGPPVGAQVAVLPPGCASMMINNAQYYQCGPTWYQPFFGGNGVYYQIVPTP